jgi:hypothetical protein
VQTTRQFRALFQREFGDGGFDFFDGHGPEYSCSISQMQGSA